MKGFERMKEVQYLSASELLERARDVMVPIPSQSEAQVSIATLIAMHLNNVKSMEQGVPASQLPHISAMIIGSTGSGKSYICKSLSGVCNMGFERVDSSSLTQSGVRGKNLSNVFASILERDSTFFKNPGIVIFDEFDKTFYTGNSEHDAYNPMRDFLALFETGDYTFLTENRENVTINLDKTLFLFAGACAKLPDLLKDKHKPKARCLGFGSEFESSEDKTDIDLMSTATMEDLAEYGCMSELCSRLQTLIYIPDIDNEGYKQLITDSAKTSALNKYKNCFKTRGVKLTIKDSAVELIAQQCITQKLGARSIEAIINKALLKANNYIDDNVEYNKVVLYAKDGEFDINYFKGKRKVPDIKTNSISDIDFEKIDLSENFESQHKIDIYCFRVTSNAEFKNSSQKELFHSFLQATCYYLANAVRPSERTYANLIKLAQATSNPNDFYNRSPYDVICSDYLKKNCNDENVEQNFLPYYMYFRNNSQDVNVSTFLVNALHTAAKNIYTKPEITAA